MPSQKPFLLYACCDLNGNRASYLVLSRQLPHDFILLEGPPILELIGMRELRGINEISHYINSFQYLMDLEIWLLKHRY
jgi:hypothetical protein